MDEKPWFRSYDPGVPHSLQPYPGSTLLDVFQETVEKRPDHTALIFKGRRMTYGRLAQLSDSFGAALRALGVQPGDRVALLLPNSPQAILAQLGAWKAGAIAAPLNPQLTGWELEQALNECGAETVVTLASCYKKVKSIQARTSVSRVIATDLREHYPAYLRLRAALSMDKKESARLHLQAGDDWMANLLRRHAGERPQITVRPQDPALLLFSGGVTGTPKAALGSHQALYISARQLHAYARSMLVDWQDVSVLAMPLFHVYGNVCLLGASLLGRYPLAVIPDPSDLDDLIDTIRKTRPAILHGVPALFNGLISHPAVKAGLVDFGSIKVCYSAAAPLLAETKRRFEALTGARMLEGYGMTESMMAAVIFPVYGAYKEGSTGVPLPDVEVRIAESDTGQGSLPPGEVGEILIRAPQLMVGYWGRPEETAKVIRDGWLYTGDTGYLDEDGYLFIVDRKKDLIKVGGFQVWPREVEEVIAAHPAVAEVCVAGVPDPYQGEAVQAWVVLHAGCSLNADEIRSYCHTRLIDYKVPRHIELRRTLPKTSLGKILRRELQQEARLAGQQVDPIRELMAL